MKLELRRVIIFTDNMAKMEDFYSTAIGLEIVGKEPDWIEFGAGSCNIALHSGRPKLGNRPPKLTFFANDVAMARAQLMRRGAAVFGPVKSTATFDMCDGKDPDGNPIQISSRK